MSNITVNSIKDGNKVYVVHPGVAPDPYWGTIDSCDPSIISGVLTDRIRIDGEDYIILDGDKNKMFKTSIYEYFYDYDEAKEYLDLMKLAQKLKRFL